VGITPLDIAFSSTEILNHLNIYFYLKSIGLYSCSGKRGTRDMAKSINRAVLSAITLLGSLTVCPGLAEDAQSVIASLPPVTATDPVLDRACDIIHQSKAAQERQLRRDQYKPVSPLKVVRSRRDSSHTYILGGSAAIPM
jgi:hypothetical protein